MSLETYEYRTVNAIIYICPACGQELLKPPEKGYCPSCTYHEMVPVKGSYKELVPINNNNYKEC